MILATEAAGMSRVDFGYDSAWRRVRKTVTPWDEQTSNWASAPSLDRKYLWSGWRLLLETDVLASGGEAVLRSFTWGLDLAGLNGAVNSLEQAGTIGGLLAVREYDLGGGPSPADPVDYVYLYDALGNVGQVVDWSHTPSGPDGAVVAHYEYDPYGGVTKAEGDYAADNAWRFSTKQWDDETGLGYWGYRYYSPNLGRWVSRDPIEESGGNNMYAYVVNAPVIFIDPSGKDRKNYTYEVEKPPCGYWVVCPFKLDRRGKKEEAEWGKVGIDEAEVPGFEVRFFATRETPIGDIKNAEGMTPCCCACEDESPGAIRVVQVVNSGRLVSSGPTIDPHDLRPIDDERPHGYVEGGGTRGRYPYSHQDAPISRLKATVHKFEVCAVCNYDGKDKVLGCTTFEYY